MMSISFPFLLYALGGIGLLQSASFGDASLPCKSKFKVSRTKKIIGPAEPKF